MCQFLFAEAEMATVSGIKLEKRIPQNSPDCHCEKRSERNLPFGVRGSENWK